MSKATTIQLLHIYDILAYQGHLLKSKKKHEYLKNKHSMNNLITDLELCEAVLVKLDKIASPFLVPRQGSQ